ncbi:MAG: hypothetical protein JXB62_11005, partial [Pirellulales bacterium]|nr:hypothetical protein [Pirellulales bacterium]
NVRLVDPGNNANFNDDGYTIGPPFYLTVVGEFEKSYSPYYTFDQAGNLFEWNETVVGGSWRGVRGGSWNGYSYDLCSTSRTYARPASFDWAHIGFRVARIPGPGTITLLACGAIVALACCRRRKRPADARPAAPQTACGARFWCCLLLLAACAVPADAWSAEPPDPGPAEVTLCGQPAPPPSSSICGLSLIAGPTGPQVAWMQQPAAILISLRDREEAAVTIPLGAGGFTRVSAEVRSTMPGEVRVRLEIGGSVAEATLGKAADCLTLSAEAAEPAKVVRLCSIGIGGPAAVRWSAPRLWTADGWVALPMRFDPRPEAGDAPPVLPPPRPEIERLLIEWDWRMQDGIDTAREPSSVAAAVAQTLHRGDALLADLTTRGGEVSALAQSWTRLRDESQQLAARPDAEDSAWDSLWRRVHELRRQIVLANPLMQTGPLLFVKQVPSAFSHQLTQYYGRDARPGGGLFVLERPGESFQCRQLAAALPAGSCQHPEVSHDGRRVLFSYCRVDRAPPNRDAHGDVFYHLYQVDADGANLRQLTEGPYDDFSPRELPDGRILLVSTRRGGFHRCGRGPCPVYTLAVAEADGSRPRPISYHETHEWDPAVLEDGRIVYTRWDYVDRHAVHYQQLWTTRPDGTDARAYYGNNTLNPVGVWEARPVPGSPCVMATAAAHHAMTAGSIILLDVRRGIDGPESIVRLTPDALFPESEAPLVCEPGGFWRAPVGVTGPVVVPPEAARWPGHCYRSPWPLSETYFLAAYSFDSLIGEPTANRANMFGVYCVDRFGNKELLYRDLNVASLWPIPLRARQRPGRLPSVREPAAPKQGTYFVQNVYHAWPPLPDNSVRRLRIVQVLPKSTPHANDPTLGLANASPGKQVLGTVPVEPDGSAYFTAPAEVPLAFQAVDELGRAVQVMRSVAYLQPGEQASCVGCHEPRTDAPGPGRLAAALARPPSPIAPGPEGSLPLSYPRLVQPVLDRRCVRCHDRAKPEGGVVLTGEPDGRYTVSYNALAPLVSYSAWGGKPGDFRQVNSEPLSRPGFFGARGSRLMVFLQGGHYDVALPPEEIERLVTWMDANALFYGTFDPAAQAIQQRGGQIAGPALQ